MYSRTGTFTGAQSTLRPWFRRALGDGRCSMFFKEDLLENSAALIATAEAQCRL
jgi:hypothetical protein